MVAVATRGAKFKFFKKSWKTPVRGFDSKFNRICILCGKKWWRIRKAVPHFPLNGSDFQRPATGGFPFIRQGETRAKGEKLSKKLKSWKVFFREINETSLQSWRNRQKSASGSLRIGFRSSAPLRWWTRFRRRWTTLRRSTEAPKFEISKKSKQIQVLPWQLERQKCSAHLHKLKNSNCRRQMTVTWTKAVSIVTDSKKERNRHVSQVHKGNESNVLSQLR